MPHMEMSEEVRVRLADLRPSERAVLETILRTSTRRRHEERKVAQAYRLTPEASRLLALPPYRLTAREIEVLALLFENHRSKDIALKLGISTRTVEIHRTHVMEKLDAVNVVDVVKITMAIIAATGGLVSKE